MKKHLTKSLVISKTETTKVNKLLIEHGFSIVSNDPDFIVCHGGDGTILYAERKFPQIPKLIVKRSPIRREYDYGIDNLTGVLSKIKSSEFDIREEIKLETEFKNRKLIGLNEIQVHTKIPIHAIRFSIDVDGSRIEDLIGDGVVVATPFGATGYHRSVGGGHFERGIGISFNNLHNRKVDSIVVAEDSIITIRVCRGPAWIIADNDENVIEVRSLDDASVRKSKSVANFIEVRL